VFFLMLFSIDSRDINRRQMPGAARLFVLFLYAHLFAILAGDLLGRGSLVTIASHSRAQSSLFLYAPLFAFLAGGLLGRGSLVTIASHSRARSSLFLYAHLFAFLAGNIFSVEVAWSLSHFTVVRKALCFCMHTCLPFWQEISSQSR